MLAENHFATNNGHTVGGALVDDDDVYTASESSASFHSSRASSDNGEVVFDTAAVAVAAAPQSQSQSQARRNDELVAWDADGAQATEAMRPPTSNSYEWDPEQSNEADTSSLDAVNANPLAEPALELYIAQDGITVGSAVARLRELGLVLPSTFSMDDYFAAAVEADEEEEKQGPPAASTVLSPEEWLFMVRDVWAATHLPSQSTAPSPQPIDGSPALIDTTAEKKRRSSVSFDRLAGPPPPPAQSSSEQGSIPNHYTSNASSGAGGDLSGIPPSNTTPYHSDNALLLRQLFPSDTSGQANELSQNGASGGVGAPRTATSLVKTTTTATATPRSPATTAPTKTSVPPSNGFSRPPSKVTSSEDAAAELFVLSGAIPLRTETSNASSPAALHLTVGGWDHTLRLHNHGKLPPTPIVDDATRTIVALAAAAAAAATHNGSTNNTTTTALFTNSLGSASSLSAMLTATGGHRPIAFGPFYALLMDQLRQVMGDVATGYFTCDLAHQRVYRFPDSPPPTLCLVLAAIAPTEMELLAGAPALAYLRAIGTIEAAMRALVTALEEEVRQRVRVDHSRARSLVVAPAGAVQRPASASFGPALAEALDWRDASVDPRLPSASPSAARVGSANASRPNTATSWTPGGRPSRRRPGSALSSVASRFRDEKPLDEISASVVARAKARRLLETLRRQTVPINRYEWYVRAETEAPPLETNFVSGLHANNSHSDSDDSDAMANMEEVLTLKVGPRPASNSMSRSGIAGGGGGGNASSPLTIAPDRTDTSNLYRLGGVISVSVTPIAHQATFNRLSRPRCDPRLLSGVTRAPRLSAARREAVLRRRQAEAQRANDARPQPYAAAQEPRLPAPRLYSVPARASVASTAAAAAQGARGDEMGSMGTTSMTTATTTTNTTDARRAHPPVAYELSYGSAEEVAVGASSLAAPRGSPARKHGRRRHGGRRAHGTTGTGTGPVQERSVASARARSHSRPRHAPPRAASARPCRRPAPEAGSGPSRTLFGGPTGSAPAPVKAPSRTPASRTRSARQGTRRPTRRHRPRHDAPSATSATPSLSHTLPAGAGERPSEDPYPYTHPARPSHTFPSADARPDHASQPLSHHPHPPPAHHARGGAAGKATHATRALSAETDQESFSKFEDQVMRRFSNVGEPRRPSTNDGESPLISSDTSSRSSSSTSFSRSSRSSASYASYGSGSASEDNNVAKRRPHKSHHARQPQRRQDAPRAGQTSPTMRERQANVLEAVGGGVDGVALDPDHRFSTSFPSLTAAQVSREVRRPSLPRRVLAPLLAPSSSSRLPSAERRPGSGSRVEPLDPLMFTASSVGPSAGRPPLTPMGPPSSTHRRQTS